MSSDPSRPLMGGRGQPQTLQEPRLQALYKGVSPTPQGQSHRGSTQSESKRSGTEAALEPHPACSWVGCGPGTSPAAGLPACLPSTCAREVSFWRVGQGPPLGLAYVHSEAAAGAGLAFRPCQHLSERTGALAECQPRRPRACPPCFPMSAAEEPRGRSDSGVSASSSKGGVTSPWRGSVRAWAAGGQPWGKKEP